MKNARGGMKPLRGLSRTDGYAYGDFLGGVHQMGGCSQMGRARLADVRRPRKERKRTLKQMDIQFQIGMGRSRKWLAGLDFANCGCVAPGIRPDVFTVPRPFGMARTSQGAIGGMVAFALRWMGRLHGVSGGPGNEPPQELGNLQSAAGINKDHGQSHAADHRGGLQGNRSGPGYHGINLISKETLCHSLKPAGSVVTIDRRNRTGFPRSVFRQGPFTGRPPPSQGAGIKLALMGMPSIRLVFALITVLSGAIHAWEWHWVNPRPTGNNLIHAFFGDHGRGIAVADNGEVAVTGDSGVTWKLQHAGAAHMPLAAAATLDGGTILAGGAQGLWKSGDGGRIWRRTASGAENFFDVCQAGPEAAFAAGTSGTIARSGDGGETWRTFRLDSLDRGFLGLHCGRNGFVAAVGQEGLAVKSMDSGRTWSPLPIPVTDMLACVAFVDSLRGFAAGEKGQVLDTRDGGNTWSTRTLDSTVFFRNIRVEGPRLTLSGSQGGLWKSGDGGMSWTRCETGTDQYLNRTVSVGEGMEIAIGSAGTVLRTTDDGKTWTNRRQGWNWGINGMVALSASAWTVFGANGLVLGTSNAGDSWKEWHAPSGMNLTAGSFWGRKGLLVGSRGVLLRSENGGETWLETGAPTTSRLLSGIGWFDSATVLAVGDSATLLRSDDAGENWRTLPGIPGLDNHILTAVKTLSGGKGVAIGYRELILSTSDKGNTWDVRGGSGTVNLHALAFFDDSAGMAVGTRGTVLATRDGGRTWIPHSTGFEDELRGVAMVNRDTALAAGELFFRPILRITTDGGGTWTEVPGPSANVYYGMESLGSGKVAVVGGGGTLLTADLGAGSVSLRRRGMADRVGGGLELRRLGASPLVSLTLALPFPGRLSISLHSALGKRSKPVYREALGAGRHSLTLPLVAGRRPVFLWALLRGAEGRTRSWIRRLPD